MAYDTFDTQPFRGSYRANIPNYYSAWIHAAFVLIFGALSIGYFWGSAHNIQPWEWLAIPVGLVFFNWGEYKIHKNLGHHKKSYGALFYKRHTGDHHSFFAAGQMSYEGMKDWRVILFPPWLVVIYTLALLAAWWVLGKVNMNLAGLFIGTMLLGYLSYEVFHAFEHLPANHWISRLPWVRHMRRLHELHHRRDLMQARNFNVVFPLWDWVYGTLHWEAEDPITVATTGVKMRHHIDVARSPAQLLEFVSTSTRWPEWHHYPVTITGPAGPLPKGSRFDYVSARAGQLSWEVIDSVPGQRWQARATGQRGLCIVVTYECQGTAAGTRFTRTLEYGLPGLLGHLIARFVLRKRSASDSVELLGNIRRVAEEGIPVQGSVAGAAVAA